MKIFFFFLKLVSLYVEKPQTENQFLKSSRPLSHSLVWRKWADVTQGGDTKSPRSGSTIDPETLWGTLLAAAQLEYLLGWIASWINKTKLIYFLYRQVFERFLCSWPNFRSSFIKVKVKGQDVSWLTSEFGFPQTQTLRQGFKYK